MIFKILSKSHLTNFKKISLIGAYIKIRSIRFLVNRFFSSSKVSKISVLGYKIWINEFNDFYWTFMETFIKEEYYFSTEESRPNIFDLGGHIGIPVLYFKWLYPESVVTVFEPMPDNIETLKKNIEDNSLSSVTLVEKAVSGTTGKQMFYGEGRAGFISTYTVPEEKSVHEVNTTTLSPYVTGPVTFCKMDIEGSEAEVIVELQKTGKLNHIKHLVMEYHKKDKGNKLSDIIFSLESASLSVAFMGNLSSINIKKRDFTHIMLVATSRI